MSSMADRAALFGGGDKKEGSVGSKAAMFGGGGGGGSSGGVGNKAALFGEKKDTGGGGGGGGVGNKASMFGEKVATGGAASKAAMFGGSVIKKDEKPAAAADKKKDEPKVDAAAAADKKTPSPVADAAAPEGTATVAAAAADRPKSPATTTPAADKPNPFAGALNKSPGASKPTTPKDTSLQPVAAAAAGGGGGGSTTPRASTPVTTGAAAANDSSSSIDPSSVAPAVSSSGPPPSLASAEQKATPAPVAVGAAATTADDAPLPEGWVEKMDEKTKKPYFYNKTTKETSWKRPKPDPNALPEGWVEKKDDKTGKSYYYNKATKETSWKRPASPLAEVAAATAESVAGSNALPEGWVEKKDDKTGKSYYYNKTTKETSWKRPQPDPNALPEGWVEKDDPKSGKKYYYNKTTKETSWTRPGGGGADAAAAVSKDDDDDDDELPEGWKEKVDPKNGKSYYYNKSTGESSWDRPQKKKKKMKDDDAAAAGGGGDAAAAAVEEEEDPKTKYSAEEIAAAWVELEDATTARAYWANKLTNEVAWLDPASLTAPADELKEQGWAEAEDTAGNRFYYNLKSKAVSWTWPPSNVEGGGNDLLSGLTKSHSSFGSATEGGRARRERRKSFASHATTSQAGGGGGGPIAAAGFGIQVEGPDGAAGGADNNHHHPHRRGPGTDFSEGEPELDAQGNPTTKRRTFFIKKGQPTLYVLGGEGVCDAFRLTMSRNNRINEWKYLPDMCLPEPLHTVACTHSLADKTARVWGVYADAKEPIPVEFALELRANADKKGEELVLPVPDFKVPEDCRPVPLAAGVATIGGAILCAGGFTSVADGKLTNRAWLYDIKAQRTIDLPPLQVARSSLCVAIVDRSSAMQTQWIAYAMGGFNGTRKSTVVERYILGKDCWEVINPMGSARSGFATAVVDRSIYALGGRAGYAVVPTCETMHAQTNQWAPIAAMKVARAMHSAVHYDGHIVVVGGWTGQEWTGSVERYDLSHDKWVQIVTLPVPMGHAMLALGEIAKDEAVQDETFG